MMLYYVPSKHTKSQNEKHDFEASTDYYDLFLVNFFLFVFFLQWPHSENLGS